MNKLIIANLKMNLNKKEIVEYKKTIEESNIKEFIICPPNIYIGIMQSNSYSVCAQNGYHINSGAFTGEVSFAQLKSIGVNYSLIGHSERRNMFNENDEIIALKLKSCIENDIMPILCVGENKEERELGKTLEVIEREIKNDLKGTKFNDIIIAYEPVWAIGTGLIPTKEDINEVHLHIKKVLKDIYNKDVKVLYGGSVKLSNIKEICNIISVDGVLIGGASNDPNNLISMYNELNVL